MWTTVLHQPLVDLDDDRVSAVTLDELFVLHSKVNQVTQERNVQH